MKKQARHITKKIKQRSVSKIRLPLKLTRWTVLGTALALIFCAGASALVIQHTHRNTSKLSSDGTTSTSPLGATGQSSAKIDTDQNTAANTTQPSSSQQSSTQQKSNSAAPSSSSSGGYLDQWGCYVPTTTTSADVQRYSQCVSNAKTSWCNTQISTPSSTFNSATLQARAAYNSVMNDWQVAQYQTPHNPYSEYLADATSKFNAIYQPAFTTYTSTIQSLNQQGCSIRYPTAEAAGQYW